MHTLQSYEYVNPTNIIATALMTALLWALYRRISLLSGVTAISNDRSILISKKPG
jgi:hypothetical protein